MAEQLTTLVYATAATVDAAKATVGFRRCLHSAKQQLSRRCLLAGFDRSGRDDHRSGECGTGRADRIGRASDDRLRREDEPASELSALLTGDSLIFIRQEG